MKTYDVYVQRCFTSYVAVQANSADDAEELVRDMLNAKMIDPSQWFELNPDPECSMCDVHNDYVCFEHELFQIEEIENA